MISLPQSILVSVIREARNRFPFETGGILLGRWLEPMSGIVIQMIGPGPLARHGKLTFEPDYDYQEAEIAKAYCSPGEPPLEYLGDWHSHPRGSLDLSWKDVRVLKNIATHRAARCSDPVMCVVSGGPDWAITAWRLVEGRCVEIGVASTSVDEGKEKLKGLENVRLVRKVL